MSGRVRIRTMATLDGRIPSGADVELVAIGDDGVEVRLLANRVSIRIDASGAPIRAFVELVNVELDIEAERASE